MINSFKNFLVEEEKTVYFTFGRMNPPTIGHEKLLKKLAQKAGGNPYRIFLSPSAGDTKNPIDYKTKVKFARKAFPKYARSIVMSPNARSVMEVATAIYNEGFKNVVMVVGSDRVNEFTARLNAVNGKKGRHGFYNFKKITIESAGERDPESDKVKGMSGTKMRKAATDGNFTRFSQGLPKGLNNSDAKSLFNAVRKGLGLKEEKEFKNRIQLKPVSEKREDYVKGNLYSVGDSVVIRDTGELCNISHLGSNYVIVESNGKQYRKWLEDVEMIEKTSTPQDPDIKDRKGSQPAGYYAGLKKSTKQKRAAHFAKHGKKDDDDNSAYKPAPGDKTAKTKPSVHTKRFKQMFGDDVETAKKRIDREKAADKIKHDRMMDRARMQDVRKKNRETK